MLKKKFQYTIKVVGIRSRSHIKKGKIVLSKKPGVVFYGCSDYIYDKLEDAVNAGRKELERLGYVEDLNTRFNIRAVRPHFWYKTPVKKTEGKEMIMLIPNSNDPKTVLNT